MKKISFFRSGLLCSILTFWCPFLQFSIPSSAAASLGDPAPATSCGAAACSTALTKRKPHPGRKEPVSYDISETDKRPSATIPPYAGFVGQPSAVLKGASSKLAGAWGAFKRGTGEATGFGPVGMTPWAQDWSKIVKKDMTHDPLDKLKYIKINDTGSIYLSLSGETRLRNWFENRPLLGTKSIGDSGRFTVRNLYGADLHVGTHLRFFGQLINADAGGWNAFGYTSTYRKRLDVQQAFVELHGDLMGARAGFIFGRQQFLDAPSYILYNREVSTVPLSWNGFRAFMIWPRFRIDGYDFVETDDSQTGMFQDTENYKNRLYGFDMTWAPPDFHFGSSSGYSFVDVYYIGFKVSGSSASIAANSGTSSGSTTRNNFGLRYYGIIGPIEFSMGGTWQGGVFQYATTNISRDVNAFSVNTLVGYRLKIVTKPLFGLQADIYSGGNDTKKSGDINTYLAPFNPQTNYLDTTTYMTAANLLSVAPVIRFSPIESISIQLKYPFFWRESSDDAIYGLSSRYEFPDDLHGNFIGMAPQASLTWQIGAHLTWQQYISRFMVSHGVQQAGGSSATYYQSNLVFRF